MIPKICTVLLVCLILQTVCLAEGSKVVPTDSTIAMQVEIKLAADQIVKGTAIAVNVMDGVVTLSGAVETIQIKARPAKLAQKVKGVKQVLNNLEVSTHPGQ